MSAAISVFLPAAMIILMIALGLRLAPGALVAVLRAPRALVLGLCVQLVGLPLLAFALGRGFGLAPALMAGLMLVAASPGGVTSNYATLLARGAVGLSVSMTLVTSLMAPLSLPLVLGLAGVGGLEAGGLWRVSLGMTAVAVLPLTLGMAVAWAVPRLAARVAGVLDPVARALFVLMVLATFVQNWSAMGAGFAGVGWAVVALAVAGPALALGAARLGRLGGAETRTVLIEASLQNVAITIFVATTLLGDAGLAIPGLIYAVLMNLVALGIIAAAHLLKLRGG